MFTQAQNALSHLAVRSIGLEGKSFVIVIGNTGRQMNKDRAFRGRDLDALTAKIITHFDKF